MGNTKKYWKSPEELIGDKKFLKEQENEFPKEMSIDEFIGDEKVQQAGTNRRDFLKFLGFSVGAATLAACETPVIRSIPYVNKPEEITPGVANWYASTYSDGNDFANILVKTREGRPIHIMGNTSTGILTGGINPRINSSVLDLYNDKRLKWPKMQQEPASWSKVDAGIVQHLSKLDAGAKVRILSGSIISPSMRAAIDQFKAKWGGASATNPIGGQMAASTGMLGGGANIEHVSYDPISYNGMRIANKENFGIDGIANYDFSKAKTIVSIGADFLANWLLGNQYPGQWAEGRDPKGEMSKHFQFETIMSVSGANADVRVPIKPSQEGAVVAAICNKLGGSVSGGGNLDPDTVAKVDQAVKALKANRGRSLVVAGSNDKNIQSVVNKINVMLENYGSTIDLDNALTIKQGDDKAVDELITAVTKGEIDTLFICGVNPVYSHPRGAELAKALQDGKVKMAVSFSMFEDETATNCHFIAPDNHYLESWMDYEIMPDNYAIVQPVISPLHDSRQAASSFLKWCGESTDFLAFMQDYWRNNIYTGVDFTAYWNQTIHDGGVSNHKATPSGKTHNGTLMTIPAMEGEGDTEVVFYVDASMGDGTQAANPWLQEMPDPISKVTWDNYITMNPKDAESRGFNLLIGQERPASVATIHVNGQSMWLPVYPSPGQTIGTIGVAMGYGRTAGADKIGGAAYHYARYGAPVLDTNGNHQAVGKNVAPMTRLAADTMCYTGTGTVTAETMTYDLACTQTHHTVMGRTSILRETEINVYKSGDKQQFNPEHLLARHEHGKTVKTPIKDIDLWDAHPVEKVGHRWGLSIDLNTCTGCGTCITACNSENNISVVGKDEVWRSRDMHWMRLDRYYSTDDDAGHREWKETGDGDFTYKGLEKPSYYPKVTFVPMMCQHCNHAPCETVCPVAATTHSNEGLNQMTYNRCIGTRYCANNCPFKVRRFNWFNYQNNERFTGVNPAQSDLGRMVLNPDVVVRSRGVMEKCSMCVQNIQAGKLQARKESRGVMDGEIQTACSSGCPTNAITFGDYNDETSMIAEHSASDRAYYMLEEVGVRPNITYMVKVRNTEGKVPVAAETSAVPATDHSDRTH